MYVGVLGLLGLLAVRYPDPPPPAHTGGFGEPTCHTCHFDGPLNAPKGGLRVAGFPEAFTLGQTYPITVYLTHPEMRRSGFQLAARYPDGTQAGRFVQADGIALDTLGGIAYVRPTRAPWIADSARWHFTWVAPAIADSVIIHVSANAANGDDSDFGDLIYTWTVRFHTFP